MRGADAEVPIAEQVSQLHTASTSSNLCDRCPAEQAVAAADTNVPVPLFFSWAGRACFGVKPNAVMAHSDATLRFPTAAASHGMPGYVSADSGIALADRQPRCSCSFRCCYLQCADLLTGVCIRQGAPGPLLAEVRHSLQLAYFSIFMRSQQAQLLPAQPAGSSRGFRQLIQGAHTAGVA